jgi:hypothetical protein
MASLCSPDDKVSSSFFWQPPDVSTLQCHAVRLKASTYECLSEISAKWSIPCSMNIDWLAEQLSLLKKDFLAIARRQTSLCHSFPPKSISPLYCNRFDQRVARQQFCKHGTTRTNRWVCAFYVVRAEQRWNNGFMQPASRQRLDKHISTYRNVLWTRWRHQQ